MKPLLTVKNLRVQISTPNGIIQPVDGVEFELFAGEIFALVGESGCGKSMTALSINRLLPDNAYLCEGTEIFLDGTPLHQLSENTMREIRKNKIGMIFQDPSTALNPVLTIGEQVLEALNGRNGHKKSTKELKREVLDLLDKVRLPHPQAILNQYPHQLSGGLKQRVVIAMALAQSPSLLIADEATTALDVTTQAQVLSLLKELNQSLNMAILLITHDLGIVAQMADTVGVMYAGHLVEVANSDEFMQSCKHPYTKQLFAAMPEHTNRNHELAVIPGQVPRLDKTFTLCRFKDRCKYVFSQCEHVIPPFLEIKTTQKVRCLWYDQTALRKIPTPLRIEAINKNNTAYQEEDERFDQEQSDIILTVNDLKVHFPVKKGLFKKTIGHIKAVDGVNFHLEEGKTLALVGESGCGKTTVGKAILNLVENAHGKVLFENNSVLHLKGKKLKNLRAQMQMIFQDPFSSMDPRMRISEIIAEGMVALDIGTNQEERQERINVLLEQVGLPLSLKERFAHELSGGQRQRVAIARALAVGASLIICDEPTSALDVSVQAQILNLLRSLQNDLAISLLFITHNISVVNYLADYVAVMYLGRIVEYGTVQQVLHSPKHPYTQALLQSVPKLQRQESYFKTVKGELPSPMHPPKGCHFSARCPSVHARCLEKYPENYPINDTHQVKCYLYSQEEISKEALHERQVGQR
ncbi:MAG: ABC transporter ATP-binding protein [Proteobacteria bacterium]|nr:ABC transporter ATP-binding protein [Pseudomonadota bacterium]